VDTQLKKHLNSQSPKCVNDWGIFGHDTLLTESQLVVHAHAAQDNSSKLALKDVDTTHLFIHPPSNFAFCTIPKNGATRWTAVLSKILYQNVNLNGASFGVAKESVEIYGVAAAQTILEDPKATVAVVVRDPLARFVSAYLNKRFDLNCGSGFCFLMRASKDQKHETIPFRQALTWMTDSERNVAKIDEHWRLQSEFCNLKNGGVHQYYSVVGKMEKETLSSDASCLMEMAGTQKWNVQSNATNAPPFWGDRNEKISSKSYRQESETEVLKNLYTPELARAVIKKMQQDYETFQLPEPEWVASATGEWMDSLDHHTCATRVY
jgi:hypothetical protein